MTSPAPALVDAAVVADLERRFHAFLVDRVIGWSLAAGAGVAAWAAGLGAWAAVAAAIGTLLVVSLAMAGLLGARGTSPGRALLGVRVVDQATGTPIGVGRALLRQLVLGLGTLPMLGLGTATLAWTAAADRGGGRRGWHDHRCRCVVVDVRPRTAAGEVADQRPREVVNLTAMRLVPAQERGLAPAAPRAVDAARRPGPRAPGRRRTAWRIEADTGESLVVAGVVLVGRNPEPGPGERADQLVPLRSTDMSVSKTHARFHVAPDGALVLTDRGSTNGTVLLRRGMSRELGAGREATLLDGDRVGVGDRELRVSREDG